MYLGFTVQAADISIHALREEGDLSGIGNLFSSADFYPRPPRGGRPSFLVSAAVCFGISIHALREEGDSHAGSSPAGLPNFYPRPPRGGRHVTTLNYPRIIEFLSTPSARRATSARGSRFVWSARFLSTPSARRATHTLVVVLRVYQISIHALREEGDTSPPSTTPASSNFYPRPPRGGRPLPEARVLCGLRDFYPRPPRGGRPLSSILTC